VKSKLKEKLNKNEVMMKRDGLKGKRFFDLSRSRESAKNFRDCTNAMRAR